MVSPGVNRPASYKLVGRFSLPARALSNVVGQHGLRALVYAARPLTRVKRDECRFANSCYELPLELA